jgi:hypothetical protein
MYPKTSIELFSGSCHISHALAKKGFTTFTVDNNPKLKPALCADILKLNHHSLPGSAAIFWASPDCSKFSRATPQKHWAKKTVSYRNYEYTPLTEASRCALNLLEKTIELIQFNQPGVWFMENPVGRIPHFACMRKFGHYRYCVNYQDWGFTYSKETYIFSNILLPLPSTVQKRKGPGLRSINKSYNRSLIPPALIDFLIDHACKTLGYQ